MANSERESCHWFELGMKLHRVGSEWEDATDFGDEYYSFSGTLDPSAEKKCHSKLIVCGTVLDTYLKELGKITGIQKSSKLLIPWQVMVNFIILAKTGAATLGGPEGPWTPHFSYHQNFAPYSLPLCPKFYLP